MYVPNLSLSRKSFRSAEKICAICVTNISCSLPHYNASNIAIYFIFNRSNN
uniref:Uncharacterized protein n=1 Tax=Ascaris lumbricoides TaxID=6252 RepID=A0A0M3I8Y7_ASCLU